MNKQTICDDFNQERNLNNICLADMNSRKVMHKEKKNA